MLPAPSLPDASNGRASRWKLGSFSGSTRGGYRRSSFQAPCSRWNSTALFPPHIINARWVLDSSSQLNSRPDMLRHIHNRLRRHPVASSTCRFATFASPASAAVAQPLRTIDTVETMPGPTTPSPSVNPNWHSRTSTALNQPYV